MSVTPSLHVARTKKKLADGKVYEYAYLRYEVWDEAKKRLQPVPVATLGRTDRLDEWRTRSLGAFLREWLRKDSSLPFEALKERFEVAEPAFQILCSRDFGLRFIVEQAWRELGYADAVKAIASDDESKSRVIEIAIFAMVLVQLVAPQSKRGALEWADVEVFFPEAQEIARDDLYEAMDVLAEHYDLVEEKLAEALRTHRAAPTELGQDTTTVACHIRYDDKERAAIEAARQARGEAERPAVVNDPPLRMRGKSKSKRCDLPQVVIEAIVGDNKLVVHHTTQPGNASEKSLVGPTIEALTRLGYREVRWASDAGFNSARNRDLLRAARWDFVSAEGTARTSVVKMVLSQPGRYAAHPDREELSFKCVLAEATEERKKAGRDTREKKGPTRLYVIRRDAHEEAYALHTLERHLTKIRATLEQGGEDCAALLHHRTYKRFVRRDARKKDKHGKPAGPVILDLEAIEHARTIAGKSVIATDALDAHPVDVDDLYRLTGEIELVYRDLKSTIEVGPVRHRRADRICAHVMIAVMAYNLGAWISRRTGRSIEAIRRLLTNLRVQEVQVGAARYWERVDLTPTQEELFEKLGFDIPPKRFVTSPAGTGASETLNSS